MISGDSPDHSDTATRITVPAPVQYFSTSIKNDVPFTFYNNSSALNKVRLNGEVLSKKDYLVTKDGHGIILKDTALTDYSSSDGSADIEFEMKDGAKASASVIIVP